MPKVKCPKCGRIWYGWSLKYVQSQTCTCGEKLKIKEV